METSRRSTRGMGASSAMIALLLVVTASLCACEGPTAHPADPAIESPDGPQSCARCHPPADKGPNRPPKELPPAWDDSPSKGKGKLKKPRPEEPPPEEPPPEEPPPEEPPDIGTLIGSFDLSYYWIVAEADYPGPQDVPLYGGDGGVLAWVSAGFAEAVSLEGTGTLLDGRLVNLLTECAFAEPTGWCFFEVDTTEAPYGWGAYGILWPYRSVALGGQAELSWTGHVLYMPALHGLTVTGPEGTFVHDGCVAAVDSGWSIDGSEVDLFTATIQGYFELDPQVPTWVDLRAGASHCPSTVAELYGL